MQQKNKTQQFDSKRIGWREMMALKQHDPSDKKEQLDEERLLEPKYIKQRLKIGMSFGKGVHMVQIS